LQASTLKHYLVTQRYLIKFWKRIFVSVASC
jgi:hypothetical protein